MLNKRGKRNKRKNGKEAEREEKRKDQCIGTRKANVLSDFH